MDVESCNVGHEIMAVDGGMLEFEEESLSSPLLCRRGDGEETGVQQYHQHEITSPLLMPETIIEQSPHLNNDGSIAIKASTITPHSNGYSDVKVEHYVIPRAVAKTSSPGSPPQLNAEYLTRVEYRVLSPGLESKPPPADDDDDASTVYTVFAPSPLHHSSGDSISVASTIYTRNTSKRRRRQKKRYGTTALVVIGGVMFLAIVIGVAVHRDYNQYQSPSSEDDENDNTVPASNETDSSVINDEDDMHGSTNGTDTNSTSPGYIALLK